LLALAACSDNNNPAAPVAEPMADLEASRSSHGPRVQVTSDDDAGKGSFRWAVEQANADPQVREIEFKGRRRPILLQSPVTYTGSQDLALEGNDAIIDGANAGGPAFIANGGGDLKVSELTFRNSPAEGIDVEVPAAATGTISVRLDRVTIADNEGHGVLVNDQVHPETEDDVQPVADGSAASLYVEVIGSSFIRNGYSVSDRDGLRVNEGGEGSLTFVARLSRSEDNAADGIELDERGAGDVRIDVTGVRLARNGKFDPLDFDDGFDIDEYDDGSLLGTISASSSLDNYEEGFDFNENNAGDFKVDMYLVNASGNAEEGIDYEEDDDFAGGGDLVTTLSGIVANRNGGDGGLKIREKGIGLLTAKVTGIEANENVESGISVREDADGTLTSSIVRARTIGNAAHGIDFDENSTGDLVATVSKSVSSGNTLSGIRADQQLPGTGTLLLTQVDLAGNTGGTITGSNVTVTQ
jgi:hypothetical protein